MTRSRALILEASRRVFLDEGYQVATVERVAAEAGIAKRTIYNLYVDKESLFRATILSAIEIADEFSAGLASDVRRAEASVDEIRQIARQLAEATLLGPALALRRLLVMESRRFPELVTEYRHRAPEAVMRALAEYFGSLSESGLLRPSVDSMLAAEHFAFLIMGADLDRGMFTGTAPTRGAVRARADAGARAFLAAYSSAL